MLESDPVGATWGTGGRRAPRLHLASSSHSAMWETNRMLLFEASLDWLRTGAVQGTENGELRLGS